MHANYDILTEQLLAEQARRLRGSAHAARAQPRGATADARV
jgi:hypothetical protein